MTAALDNFVSVLNRSGLLEEGVVSARLEEFKSQSSALTSERFASWLVEQEVLTAWQASKLLQGKHKGFFLGKYRLLKLLGKGGMSSVYLAEHTLLHRLCAIKVLPAKLVHDSAFLQRFHREARAGAALDHPNIVRAFDVDHQLDGNLEIHFLVMEYVDGRNLYDLIAVQGPLSPATAARFMRQAALGLAHAHGAGIIHRDVKPGNFIVDQQGIVKLTDLGLARIDQPDRDHSLTMQYDQKVFGTADYLAPEQAVDSHRVDARADLYALGCTFYFLLTGQAPFPDGTLTQRLLAHQTTPPPDVIRLRPDVPESLSRMIVQLLAKKPQDRPASAALVAQELTDWLTGQGEALPAREIAHVHTLASQTPAQGPAGAGIPPAAPTVEDTLSSSDPQLSSFLAFVARQQSQPGDQRDHSAIDFNIPRDDSTVFSAVSGSGQRSGKRNNAKLSADQPVLPPPPGRMRSFLAAMRSWLKPEFRANLWSRCQPFLPWLGLILAAMLLTGAGAFAVTAWLRSR